MLASFKVKSPKSAITGLFLLGTIFIYTACSDEIELSSGWEDCPVVYAVINIKDSAHFIRVHRTMVTGSENEDSIYYPIEDIRVSLTEMEAGLPVGEDILFTPAIHTPKDSGLFLKSPNIVYKSTASLKGNTDYQLVVLNKKWNKVTRANIRFLGERNFNYTYDEEVRETTYPPYVVHCMEDFNIHDNYYAGRVTRFLYKMISGNDTLKRYIDYFSEADTAGFNKSRGNYLGVNNVFAHVGKILKTDKNIRLIPVGMDYLELYGSEDLQMYINANAPSVFFKPTFSNIENGVGLFASRYHHNVFAKRFSNELIDSLAYGQYTRHLNFCDSEGNFKW